MSTINDSDLFLVQRSQTTFKTQAKDLMSTIQDTDLMLINRSGQSYKVTCADVKEQLGGGGLDPRPEDITVTPNFQGGTGTDVDPFILATKTLRPAGSTTSSDEFITITVPGAEVGTTVTWTDNSVGAGDRFAQPSGTVAADGTWSGRLVYNDTPDTTVDQDYVGKLQIGIVHFQWTIEQKVSALEPPVIDSFTLTEADTGGNRFTSQNFNAALTMTSDGPPLATKTFDAKVEGSILEPVVTDSISVVNTNAAVVGDEWEIKYEQSWTSAMNSVIGSGSTYAWSKRGSYVWRIDLAAGTGTNKGSGNSSIAFYVKSNSTRLLMSEGNGTYKFSIDAGDSWTNTNANSSGTPFEICDVVGNANGTWLVVKHDDIWFNSYENNNWGYVSKPGTWPNFTSRYCYHCDGYVFANGGKTQSNNGYIAYTVSGTNWSFNEFTVPGQSDSSIEFCCVPTSGTVYVKTRNNVYARFPNKESISSGNCTVWTAPASSGTLVQMYASGNNVIAAWTNGEIWKSTDAGDNWEKMDMPSQAIPSQTMGGYPYNTPSLFADGLYFAFNNGILKTGVTGTALTFSGSTNLDKLSKGDPLTQSNNAANGTIGSINGNEVALATTTGTWSVGQTTYGPSEPVANTTKYLEFDSNGNVTDLLDSPQDPPFTTTDADPTLTLKFPATFPSGNTPDEELTDGTTLTVSVDVENASGTDTANATVQPEGVPASTAGLFSSYEYTGTGNYQVVNTGVNTSNGGMIWLKNTGAGQNHNLYDTERGPYLRFVSNNDQVSEYNNNGIDTFGENGFDLYGSGNETNHSGNNYIAWSFGKAMGLFTVVKYQCPSGPVADLTIPHDLGSVPGCIIIKAVGKSTAWNVWNHSKDGHTGFLNLQDMFYADNRIKAVNGSSFQISTSDQINSPDQEYVAYLFGDSPGLIKCGKYNGTGGTHVVDCGFEPQWIMIKSSSQSSDWIIQDSVRGGGKWLSPNRATATSSTTASNLSFVPTGFQLQSNVGDTNQSGQEYLYIAIAKPVIRSMTQDKFAESTAKFATYNNRRDVHQGELAMAERERLASELQDKGISPEVIEQAMPKKKRTRKKQN